MALAFVIEVVEGIGGGEGAHAFHVYLNSRLKFYLELGEFFSVRQRTVVYLSCITHHSYHGLWVGYNDLINGLIAAASGALVC